LVSSLHLAGTHVCQPMVCSFCQANAPRPSSITAVHVHRRELIRGKGQEHTVKTKTKRMLVSVRSRLMNRNKNSWGQLLRFAIVSS
jgi:hypothetical protein